MDGSAKYNGLLAVWKEQGYTSHDVVARMRGILQQKKIGHTGTLDPQAEGVLVVGLGLGTKTFELLLDKNKVYEAEITLGVETDTEDIWGNVISSCDVSCPAEIFSEAILSFQGSYEQLPPMYSAKKIGGKRLYELARAGKVVERKPAVVTINSISVKSICKNKAVFTVDCSAGTYIRSLCRDIGERLGTKACMSRLTRKAAGVFSAEQAVTLQELEELAQASRVEQVMISVEQALCAYPSLTVKKQYAVPLKNGNSFGKEALLKEQEHDAEGLFCVSLENDGFIGVFRRDSEKEHFVPVKIFYRNK